MQDLNFTQTARRLFITQQNLSNHVQRLEEAYQARLFRRRPRLELTDAGRQLLRFAQSVLAQEERVRQVIRDYDGQDRGTLRIGTSAPRARGIMPEVLRQFSGEFPKVGITLVSHTSRDLVPLVEDGSVDLAVGVFPHHAASLTSQVLVEDRLYLVVAESLLERVFGPDGWQLPLERYQKQVCPELLARLPVILPLRGNALTDSILDCYQSAGCQSQVYLSTEYPQFYLPLCLEGVAAGFFLRMSLLHDLPQIPAGVHCLPLVALGGPVCQRVSVLYQRHRPATRFQQRFLAVLTAYFAQQDQRPFPDTASSAAENMNQS